MTSPRRVQKTCGGIACKLPLYHIQSGHLMGLADEVNFELECSNHETPSAKDLRY